jgi:hypothetical protein
LREFGGKDEDDEDEDSGPEPTYSFQPDPTSPEDMVQFNLAMGNNTAALSYAAKHDPWLAAHLAIFMDELNLLKEKDKQSVLPMY